MENHEDIIFIRVERGDEEPEGEEIINRRRKGEFKQFDIIHTANDDENTSNNSSISDHHYYADQQTNLYSSETNNRIMKEWKILKEGLPADSIYVRVYEDRIDLLRAVIVGAAGTPYHDGLFFFDIQFPSDYPNHPPKVYYHSFGFRLNPNLYPKRGTVCLSLLNTFSGQKNERWNPSESTLLQVLVSIQALILNAKPYFNNPNNSIAGDYSKESLVYNQEAYIDGRIEVGDDDNTTGSSDVSKKSQDSMAMGIIYSKLVKAFIKNGSSSSSSLESYLKDNIMDADHQVELPDTRTSTAMSIFIWLVVFILCDIEPFLRFFYTYKN
ncbi:Ubiquitin-conjugating enzyme [Macleaya cordata]|uniref:Ubiquitin-conjugating enzyme n=1 Tax=Macleaya cordata TaxID=56857 RepID=A0A200QU67_MACCD|nr:Ubiquitin-conjugating enzyme [Macleaya cordata]